MKIGTSSLDTSVFDLAINNIYRPDECVRSGSPRPQWFPPPPPRRRERTLDARVLFFAPPPLPSPTAAHHRTQHVHPSRPRALRYEAAVALKEDARNDIDLAEAERSQKLTQVRRRRSAPPQRGSSARRAVVRLPRGRLCVSRAVSSSSSSSSSSSRPVSCPSSSSSSHARNLHRQARTKLLEAQTEANRTLNAAYTSVRVIESFATSNATAIARQYAAWETMCVRPSSSSSRRARGRKRTAERVPRVATMIVPAAAPRRLPACVGARKGRRAERRSGSRRLWPSAPPNAPPPRRPWRETLR